MFNAKWSAVVLMSLTAVACGGSEKPASDPSNEAQTRTGEAAGTDSSRNGNSPAASMGSEPADKNEPTETK